MCLRQFLSKRKTLKKIIDMRRFYRKNFVFHVERVEEWQDGSCVCMDEIETTIASHVMPDGSIVFKVRTPSYLRMVDTFKFDNMGDDFEILHDRIQYMNTDEHISNKCPKICNVFIENDTISCVRFAMTSPDRIIEFYGTLEKISAPLQIGGVPSKELIQNLVKDIMAIKTQMWKMHDKTGNFEFFTIGRSMEMFLNPLYYAWQKLKYGWHSDFWEEGDSMFEYMMYEARAKEITGDLIKLLENQSPFTALGRNDVTSNLLRVYKYIVENE